MMYDENFLARLEQGLRGALPQWGLDADSEVKLLTISENATYLVTTPSGARFILRVHRPGYHTETEIRSELAWIEALRNEGVIATSAPLPAKGGEVLATFHDGETERQAVAFTFISGKEPDAESDLPRWYRVLGEITARLHAHSRNWARPDWFARKLWSFGTIIGPGAHWGDWRAAPGLTAAGRAVLERTQKLLEKQTDEYGYAPERFGLVHCDMRPANLLVEDARLNVIDFDDCGISWYVYDFAASISFLEHEPYVPELKRAWLEGYRSVAPLSEADEAALPMFVMLRRMQLTAWIATHGETPTAQSMGEDYVRGTVALAEAYLEKHGVEVTA